MIGCPFVLYPQCPCHMKDSCVECRRFVSSIHITGEGLTLSILVIGTEKHFKFSLRSITAVDEPAHILGKGGLAAHHSYP